MNDEGIGIAGWLLADLVLVLAIVFLAFTPAALSGDAESAATAEATPVRRPADRRHRLRCHARWTAAGSTCPLRA